jgi:hypothetical protein
MKIKARVKDKVFLILLDSGSSHSFISSNFVDVAQLPIVSLSPRKVKLANGESIIADKKIPHLRWYCQGHTLNTDMVVLDMHPYDAILGFDWLQDHSPMQCDWQKKTLIFFEMGKAITIQGLQEPPLQLHSMSATKVYNSDKGNDVWAYALLDYIPAPISTAVPQQPTNPLSGTSKTGYPIFIAKPPTKTNIMAHGPSQPAQALLCSKPKPKDKRPSPPALLRFVRPLSVSSDPRDVIQAPEPYDVIKALDHFA